MIFRFNVQWTNYFLHAAALLISALFSHFILLWKQKIFSFFLSLYQFNVHIWTNMCWWSTTTRRQNQTTKKNENEVKHHSQTKNKWRRIIKQFGWSSSTAQYIWMQLNACTNTRKCQIHVGMLATITIANDWPCKLTKDFLFFTFIKNRFS